ncbi:phosphonate metabolism transcriptional regulator PhnF [Hoeflea sp. TYP-13]|uniref:phosphonate metabolism transcriptional regulator PhnF n=1 Tax=Hoeflea sp. TYP-13 TaxID=3230023 RepID=UPI0034C5C860
MEFVERRSGISLWRQIADQIRIAISNGEYDDRNMLPGEIALAKRFNVNRHTVRSAIASLAREGVVRVEQGRGTFITRRKRLQYPIGRRTRFSEGLAGQIRSRDRVLKDHGLQPAPSHVSRALALEPGATVVRLETVNTADKLPVSRAISWFDGNRFPDFADRYEKYHSITAILKSYGIKDYLRVSTRISAHHADPTTLKDLQLSPGAIMLRTEAINAEIGGRPVEYSNTFFAADRIELDIDHSAPVPAN